MRLPANDRRKIKRRIDRAAELMSQAREIARRTFPEAYVFCEGSGRIHVLPDIDARSERALVYSNHGAFDAGGW